MRALVTGANGLVGSRLCLSLIGRGHEVFGCSHGPARPPLPAEPIAGLTYRRCELTVESEVGQAFEMAKPDVVFHPASMTNVDACERDPFAAYANNVTATVNVAVVARRLGSHLIYVSTDYVFDGEGGPYSEEDTPNARGTYSTTKQMAEQVVRIFAPSFAIARTAIVYGWPPAARPNFGTWLIQNLRGGQKVNLFEDQWVSPSLADSVAAMLVELAERKLSGIWNICGASIVNRMTFGKMLCDQFGFDDRLLIRSKLREANLPSPRPRHSGLLTAKAARELTEKPLELKQAMARFHAAYVAWGRESKG